MKELMSKAINKSQANNPNKTSANINPSKLPSFSHISTSLSRNEVVRKARDALPTGSHDAGENNVNRDNDDDVGRIRPAIFPRNIRLQRGATPRGSLLVHHHHHPHRRVVILLDFLVLAMIVGTSDGTRDEILGNRSHVSLRARGSVRPGFGSCCQSSRGPGGQILDFGWSSINATCAIETEVVW